jgi:hypothetical protein
MISILLHSEMVQTFGECGYCYEDIHQLEDLEK